ncbi:vacuolar lysine transporter YPQ1-like [Wolffia australiana]
MGRRGNGSRLLEGSVMVSGEELSFGLGIASLIFWGVAEIPQIIANYRTKSGHGVSFLLLSTWVIGDVFNLAGCALEPATLPTQLYTAVLYTAITLILVLQTLYYDYAARWRKTEFVTVSQHLEHEEHDKNLERPPHFTAAIPLPASSTHLRPDIHYTSARSLANSGTPTFRSYLGAWSEPTGQTPALLLDAESPPLRRSAPMSLSPGRRALLGICVSLSLPAEALTVRVPAALEVLQESDLGVGSYGVLLGWMMAVIYMGGRLPQIILNIRRGSIEGLSPTMFVLAVLGNASYVGSILVSSVEWIRLRDNAPWLVDAAVCVLLDLFILLQFIYYKWINGGRKRHLKESIGDYAEIKPQSTK